VESSVLALGIPMAAPPARADGPSLRRDIHDGFGDMLGRALHQDGPAPEPGNASPRRPAEDAKPDAPEWAHAGTAPLHAPTPAPSKYQPSRPADAGAVDPPVSDAPAPQKLGNSGRRREDSADLTDLSNRAPDPAEPALAAVGQPAPSADAPISPGLPGRVAGLVDEEPDDLCGEELTQVVDALFETAEAVEGDTAAAVPTAQVAAELPVSDTRGAMPPQVPAHSSGEVQDVSVTGPDRPAPFGDRVQPEARPEGLRGAIPARPAAAAVAGRAGVLPDDAVAALQDTAAAAQNLGDPGLTRRLAATAAGLVESLPDTTRNAAAAPPAPAASPAVILDALRGARVTVNQVQPSQAWSAAAAARAVRTGVLPDDAVAALQDTAAAAEDLGDPGLTRRLAATAAGLVESLPDAARNAAATPAAATLEALRGARVTVNQIQPSQAWPTWPPAALAGRAGVLPDGAVAALEDTAASAQDLGDPGLTRRLAATAAGLVEALPDAVQNAAAAPPAPAAPPAVLLDALRGARATVNQVQPSQAWPTWSAAAAALAVRAGVLPDDAVAAFQDTAAAASAVQAYEQQAAAPRGGDWSAEFMAAGNELLRGALSAMSHAAGGDFAQSDSSSGNGSRRGTFVPLAQVAAAFGRSAVGPDSSWALAMAAGSRPAAGADAQDLGSESPVNGPSLTRSLVQTVRVQVRQGGGEAHIRLNPEHLGELSVLVKVDGSRVSATLRAESPLVRSWIEAHQQELRAALKEQGLSLDDLVIDADGRSRQEADAQAQQQRHSTPRRQMSGQQFDALI